MSYNDFLQYKFYPEYFNGTWISDTEILFPDQVRLIQTVPLCCDHLLQFGGLSVNNVATSQIQTVVSHNQFLKIHPVLYQFSADRSVYFMKLLLVQLQFLYALQLFFTFFAFRKYLLVKTSSQKVWRRSSFGSYGLIKMRGGRPATTNIIPLAPSNVSISRRAEDFKCICNKISCQVWFSGLHWKYVVSPKHFLTPKPNNAQDITKIN